VWESLLLRPKAMLALRSRWMQEQKLEHSAALALRSRWVQGQELARSLALPQQPRPPHSWTSSSSLCHHPLDPPEQLERTKWQAWTLPQPRQQPWPEARSNQKIPLQQLPAQQPAVKWKPQVAKAR
jgi:hypothetical protein